ncbi:neprilysin-2 isoform X1 [Lepeophtheirus salmonis]|uniref:neprilysin-2 isoform X1 n=2 Tax=Lepeophtheirus salmonis TaxID=72036 RepID=UPI001AE5FAA1|nr:neprilysin-2-like isoform X1 [Lepeophtheirus salmonis]
MYMEHSILMLFFFLIQRQLIVLGTVEERICRTEECLTAAKRILLNMNASVSPCEDFYEFSCGGFVKRVQIPDNKNEISSFSLVHDKLFELIKDILELDSIENEPKSFYLARNYYKACMNKSAIESLGLKPMEKVIKDLGGWPLRQGKSWNESSYLWYDKLRILRGKGLPINQFFSLNVGSDLKNHTRLRISLDQPGFNLHSAYLKKGDADEGVKAYFNYMVEIALLFGGKFNASMDEMFEVLKFENKLANITIPNEQRRNLSKMYHVMTIEELSQMDPSTPWLDCINNILRVTKVNVTQEIIVYSPSYFKDFAMLIRKTPIRVQANFLIWSVISSSMSYLNEEARHIQFKYIQKLTGAKTMSERWKTCVGETKSRLGIHIGSMYVRQYFPEKAKTAAQSIVSYIKKEFEKLLRQNKWSDEETKAKALKKVKAMHENIGYPNEILNNTVIDILYEGLDLGESTYFENVHSLFKWTMDYVFFKIENEIKSYDWTDLVTPTVVNAFYNPLTNSINIPAGILQGNFFSLHRPNYLNFGAIGMAIGHEITHGFDDTGRQFNFEGDLFDWWNPSTKLKFINKTKCIIEEYGDFAYPKLNTTVNGVNTLGENIADNGGLKVAYRAYASWLNQTSFPEPLLPGLNFTEKQLFWISNANLWCTKIRAKTLEQKIRRDVHTPAMFRVLGAFSNMVKFAEDFQCPIGSPMNPKIKCEVW